MHLALPKELFVSFTPVSLAMRHQYLLCNACQQAIRYMPSNLCKPIGTDSLVLFDKPKLFTSMVNHTAGSLVSLRSRISNPCRLTNWNGAGRI